MGTGHAAGALWQYGPKGKTIMLPKEFLERMEQMLGEEFPAFSDSYESESCQSLRVNPLKTEREAFLSRAPFHLKPVPWVKEGFYYAPGDQPGKHPYHEAGVYYIQEPSAMAPAEYLIQEPDPDARILDLCAAPGGKSTQLAAAMRGQGILVSNEIHPARARILSENVERMGVTNAMVTNETPQSLSKVFSGYFTHILVDAPCSGEGMFRKNEEACAQWSLENVEACAVRQDEILHCASEMLAPGGRLVYSTCTFAPAENEGSISRFLRSHPEISLMDAVKTGGMESGRAAWTKDAAAGMEKTVRLWPHKLKGEGHFLAVLKKAGEPGKLRAGHCQNGLEQGILERELLAPQKGCAEYLEFAEEHLARKPEGIYLRFGDQLYLAPFGMPAVRGLKVLRPGLHLGTVKKNRFEPSHALALAAGLKAVRRTADLPPDGKTIREYLNGQTFSWEGEKGWYLVTVDGYGIGWGKLAGGIMKNHYPKGLRKNL